jgi:hypothetical protein
MSASQISLITLRAPTSMVDELAELARSHDRSLSAEVRIAIKQRLDSVSSSGRRDHSLASAGPRVEGES